jgi:hypothetical protein
MCARMLYCFTPDSSRPEKNEAKAEEDYDDDSD